MLDLALGAARADLEPFSVLRFLCKSIGLERSVVLQSDVSLFLQILGLKEILIEIRRLELDRLILYESDMLQLQQNFKAHQVDLTRLVSITFERTKFESCSRLASGEVSGVNLSFVFLAPNLQLLSLKQSNFLEVLTDEEIAAFCEKLKMVELHTLNLEEVCPTMHNCRKYDRILEAIGGGFRGDNRRRVSVLDLSFNILLGRTISTSVVPFVGELKLCQHSCNNILIKSKVKQEAALPNFQVNLQLEDKERVSIDPDFLEIVDQLAKQPGQLQIIHFHQAKPLLLRTSSEDSSIGSLSTLWFQTDCVHEFIANMR